MKFSRCVGMFLVMLVPSLTAPGYARATAAAQWRRVTPPRPVPLFYEASGIAVGTAGNIFIADVGDHRLKKYSPAGVLLASWGSDSAGPMKFQGPYAVAVGLDGRVFAADDGVVVLSPTGTVERRWRADALVRAGALAVDRTGNLYALSTHPVPHTTIFDRLTIARLTPSGKTITVFTATYPLPFGAYGAALAAAPNGNVLLSVRAARPCHDCNSTYSTLQILSPTGHLLSQTSEDMGGVSVGAAANGDIYLTGGGNFERLSANGTRLAGFPSVSCGSTNGEGRPLRLAVSPLGGLYAADTRVAARLSDTFASPLRSGVLQRYGFDGTPGPLYGTCPAAKAGTLFGQINDIAIAPGGGGYVADGARSSVERLDQDGRVVATFSVPYPSSVSTDRVGNVYIPNMQTGTLDTYGSDGRLLARRAGPPVEKVAIAPNGNAYALTAFGEVLVLPPVGRGDTPLRRWWLQGYSAHAGGLSPTGICLDGRGHVWVADIRHNNIQVYSPTGRLLTIWGRGGSAMGRFQNPSGIAADGRGHVFVLDSGNNRIQEYYAITIPHLMHVYGREGEAQGQLRSPHGIAVDGAGSIYVGDRGNDRVQKLVLP